MARRSRVRGLSGLRRQLRSLPDEALRELRGEVADAAELVELEQLRLVPVDEGNLASTIEIRMGRDKLSAEIGPGAKRGVRTRRRGAWRAHFVEFGTVKARAQPFIFPALEMNRRRIVRGIAKATRKALRKGARSA